MLENQKITLHKIAYQLFQNNQKDDLEYIYIGDFSKNLTESILELAETNFEKTENNSKIKKRVYFVMVEGLQNISRHQNKTNTESYEELSFFAIQKKSNHYIITTGNIIQSDNVTELKYRLEKINNMEKEELSQYYKNVLFTGALSEKGGAGLGLIEMARKSGNKLYYKFEKKNNQFHYFYFQTIIPMGDKPTDSGSSLEMLEELIGVHKTYVANKILLGFKGLFNQDNLLNLLSIWEERKRESAAMVKVYNVMVELIQNIAKHNDKVIDNFNGNAGIFLINEDNENINLIAGNLISSKEEGLLNERLEKINNLSFEELNEQYNKTLLNFDYGDSKTTGLGFLDIRLKTKNKISFSFQERTSECSFFSIQAKINTTESEQRAIYLTATEDTPKVIFDAEKNIFEISEKSLPENAIEFYKPLIEWLDKYIKTPNEITAFNFRLDYFNTATSKQIIRIFISLQKLSEEKDVLINWYYREIDEDMRLTGIRFSQLVKVNLKLIEY